MKSFTLVTFNTTGTVTVRTRSWKHFSPKYLKAWVLSKLRHEEEWEGPIRDVQLYDGGLGDDYAFGDWEKLPQVYLDIC